MFALPGRAERHQLTAQRADRKPDGRTGLIAVTLPLGNPGRRKLFTIAALLDEVAFQRDRSAGPAGSLPGGSSKSPYWPRWRCQHGSTKVRNGRKHQTDRTDRIVGFCLPRSAPQVPHPPCLGRVFVPERQPTLTQKVFVIQKQFIQAGSRHVDQPQFGLA